MSATVCMYLKYIVICFRNLKEKYFKYNTYICELKVLFQLNICRQIELI